MVDKRRNYPSGPSLTSEGTTPDPQLESGLVNYVDAINDQRNQDKGKPPKERQLQHLLRELDGAGSIHGEIPNVDTSIRLETELINPISQDRIPELFSYRVDLQPSVPVDPEPFTKPNSEGGRGQKIDQTTLYERAQQRAATKNKGQQER